MTQEERPGRQDPSKDGADVNQSISYDQRGQLVYGDQINVAGDVQGDVILQRLDPDDLRNQQDHAKLRQKVRLFWIEGVLKHSLYNELLIQLNVTQEADLVDNRPWDLILQRSDVDDQTLSADLSVLDLFDQMNQQVLIVGEPGSGKTTMLLELAQGLLTRAAQDPTHPTPVVFNLSSWAAERKPLAIWLVDELQEKYSIPRKLGQTWVSKNEILPLLDGLDEVDDLHQVGCIQAINQYLADHLVALAVCCRIEEYQQLTARLRLQGAIRIQLLTEEQIQQYLEKAGPALSAVRMVLATNVELQELAKSPILLNIMVLTYQNAEAATVVPTEGTTQLQHLIVSYVQRMFSHRGAESHPYRPGQTLTWLRWLGKKLATLQQSPFLIESLQPNWLDAQQQWPYLLASRLTNSLLLGLLTGLAFGLISEMYFSFGYYTDGRIVGLNLFLQGYLPTQLLIGIITGVCVAGVAGVTMTILDRRRFAQDATPRMAEPTGKMVVDKGRHIDVRYTLICGLITGLLGGYLGAQIQGEVYTFSGSLIFGLPFGLIFGLRAAKQTLNRDVQTVDAFMPSAPNVFKGIGIGMGAGLLFGVVSGLLVGLYGVITGAGVGGLLLGLIRGMFFAMGLGLAMVVGGALYWGLEIKRIETTVVPNQGIRLSIGNALRAGVITAPLSISLFGLVYGIAFAPDMGAAIGLIIGGGFGLLALLWYGGFDVIQHVALRIVLWLTDQTPWNLAHFLDFCTDKIFLHRVGGGYVFIHRLIREHIATFTDEEIEQIIIGIERGNRRTNIHT